MVLTLPHIISHYLTNTFIRGTIIIEIVMETLKVKTHSESFTEVM